MLRHQDMEENPCCGLTSKTFNIWRCSRTLEVILLHPCQVFGSLVSYNTSVSQRQSRRLKTSPFFFQMSFENKKIQKISHIKKLCKKSWCSFISHRRKLIWKNRFLFEFQRTQKCESSTSLLQSLDRYRLALTTTCETLPDDAEYTLIVPNEPESGHKINSIIV